jgi:hypothetical protein
VNEGVEATDSPPDHDDEENDDDPLSLSVSDECAADACDMACTVREAR